MIYCTTLRYEGDRGIWFVQRDKKNGFVGITISAEEGEHNLEFSPALFKILAEAFKGIEAGQDYKAADSIQHEASIKPEVCLHVDDQKVEIGFEARDDSNPLNDDWPTVIIRNKNLRLDLCLNPDQAKALMECCRKIVGLGAAADDYAKSVIELEEA
jgi:hypothetical protein